MLNVGQLKRMIKIRIKDPIVACDAGAWCNKQFGEGVWQLDIIGMFAPKPEYDFGLPNEKDAVLFALKWAVYA